MKKIVLLLLLMVLFDGAVAQELSTKDNMSSKESQTRSSERKRRQNFAQLPLPKGSWSKAQIIAGRPGDNSISLNILAPANAQGILFCNDEEIPLQLSANIPKVIELTGLLPDSRYTYYLTLDGEKSPEYSFHTQRKPGSSFIFAVQGDSHPERSHQNTPEVYAQTLRQVAQNKVDFYIMLGDDFSVDQEPNSISASRVEQIYLAQRPFLSLTNTPLFLVNGNHEQAALCNLDGKPDNVAVWAQNSREKYFPQPAPEGIFSGDNKKVEHIGFLRDYYAWEWGDALFVVLDPYWHSTMAVDNKFGTRDKNRDPWQATIGDEQYNWLKNTLEKSKAKYKFIFTHHVNGTGRGGVEAAKLYEWGGADRSKRDLFKQKRPNWEMPIHQLLLKHKVSAVFQGHDHLFSHQELDGIIYQTMPLPGGTAESMENTQAYKSGTTLPGSGFVQVKVTPTQATVEFIKNGEEKPAYSYIIKFQEVSL